MSVTLITWNLPDGATLRFRPRVRSFYLEVISGTWTNRIRVERGLIPGLFGLDLGSADDPFEYGKLYVAGPRERGAARLVLSGSTRFTMSALVIAIENAYLSVTLQDHASRCFRAFMLDAIAHTPEIPGLWRGGELGPANWYEVTPSCLLMESENESP